MEIKDVDEETFELVFTSEESAQIRAKAKEKGIPPLEVIRSFVEPAMKKTEDAIQKAIDKRRK